MRAAGLAAEIEQALPGTLVTLEPSSGGVFEVSLDGRKLFSKKALGRHAAKGEILGLIREARSSRQS